MYRTNYIANSYPLLFLTMNDSPSDLFILMNYSDANANRTTHPTKCP